MATATYVLDVLLKCGSVVQQRLGSSNASAGGLGHYQPFNEKEEAKKSGTADRRPACHFNILPCLMPTVAAVSKVRMHISPDLKSDQAREKLGRNLGEIQKRYRRGNAGVRLPLLDPVSDMGVSDPHFSTLQKQAKSLEKSLAEIRQNTQKLLKNEGKSSSSSRRKRRHSETPGADVDPNEMTEEEAYEAFRKKNELTSELSQIEERITQVGSNITS